MAKLKTVKVTAPKTKELFGGDAREVTFEKDFGGDLKTAAEKYGEDVVYALFEQKAAIQCQQAVRAHLEAANEDGSPKHLDADCIEVGVQFVPKVGSTRAPKDPFAGILGMVESGKMSKSDVLAALKEKLA